MSVVELIERHRSIRRYLEEDIREEDLRTILEASRRAPTAWNLMPIYIYVVRDRVKQKLLSEAVGGQEHVAKASVFLVYVVDYAKIMKAVEKLGIDKKEPSLSNFVEALINAGIMAGWAALTAEALGYGITFIAVYMNPCRVAEILGLENYMIPVVGLTIGKPGENPSTRPRQDSSAVYGSALVDAEKRGEAVIKIYGEKARDRLDMILNRFHVEVNEKLKECLVTKGFKI